MGRWIWDRIALTGIGAAAVIYVATQATAIMAGAGQVLSVVPGSTLLVLGDHLEAGKPGPHFRQRLDRAAEQYNLGRVAKILISGGGEPSEASAGKLYLIDKGVPEEVILPEERSCSTRWNLRFSAELLRQSGSDGPVVIVTNGFHLRRALLLAAQEGVQAVGMPAEVTRPPLSIIWPNLLREIAGITLMNVWDSPRVC